jgi:TonB family protein
VVVARRVNSTVRRLRFKDMRYWLLCLAMLLPAVGLGVQGPTRTTPQPRPITTKLPGYPIIARHACAQGAVGVLVEVDASGKVTGTEVLYGHPLLQRAARDAATEWTFDVTKDSIPRRELLRFVFHILPFEVPDKKLKPMWSTGTDVEIRAHPGEPSCDDCSEKRRRQLRHGGCS